MSDEVQKQTDDSRGGAFSPGFLALVATQFFVSLNDNMFRWIVVPIGKELFNDQWRTMPEIIRKHMNADSLALSLGLASFTLPFLLFAATSGFLADRFSKRRVMILCKVAELVIIGVGATAVHLRNAPVMFLVLFILGGQAMMFITSKFSAIPELVRSEEISKANGLINMVSMAAIILGALAGNWLYDKPWHHYTAALLGVAACGLVTSLFIGKLRAANPTRPFPWNQVGQTTRDLWELISKRPLFLAALGSTYFWMLGALSQINIDQFVTKHLCLEQLQVGPFLGLLTIGIGCGALMAGFVSRGRVELGLVAFGGLGIATASILLSLVPGGIPGKPIMVGHDALPMTWWIFGGTPPLPAVAGRYFGIALLFLMGLTAGVYDIPLQAFLQDRSPPASRGSIMAAYNFLTFAGMLLAAGLYWLLSSPLHLSSRAIFLVCGLTTLPVTYLIIRRLPFETAHLLTRMIVASMYRVRIEGLENVPAGGALVASNHVSWADGILLGLSTPRHPRMIAYADYFNSPWLHWFGRLGRIIPIGTSRKSMVESIRASREALRNGELVCIFPEGGITRSGKIEEFRPGFLSILKETDAPVVPVRLIGLWDSIFSYQGGRFFWKWPKHWRYPVTVRFGQPIWNPTDGEQVRQAVIELGDHERHTS